MVGQEIKNIIDAQLRGQLAGDGFYTKNCNQWIEENLGVNKSLLTHSCTAALEMSAILMDLKPGDEVIMPSYTFVSTANAFVLRGAKPVFVDIRRDTLNLDERGLEEAITNKTKAIVVVHYAGVACEMDKIIEIAKNNNLFLIEDAAQAFGSKYKKQYLGSFGDLASISFHETKNIISGEGGCLIVNKRDWVERSEIVREKGTDRSKFYRGKVDKYSWVDIGSSYLPGELTAAFLYAQLVASNEITKSRIKIWEKYHESFKDLEEHGRVSRPMIPSYCEHNGHMYFLLLRDLKDREYFIEHMAQNKIGCVFHYVPLHSSSYGIKHSRIVGDLKNTVELSSRLVRLPMWVGLENVQEQIIEVALKYLKS